MRAGISPAMKVKKTLIVINITHGKMCKIAMFDIPATACKTRFIGMQRIADINTPNTPAVKPMMTVSALNTRDISRFDAPTLLNTPISFVLSITDV